MNIFDFDNTLVKTKSAVYVESNGRRKKLSAKQFLSYKKKHGDKLDFSDFDILISPKNITDIVDKFQLSVASGTKTIILTSRGKAKPIDDWLRIMGMKVIPVKALGSHDPKAKAAYIERKILEGIKEITFFDDSLENIKAIDRLKQKYKHTKINTVRC